MAVNLRAYHTLGFSVNAEQVVTIRSLNELKKAWQDGLFAGRYLILGAGSNLLFSQDFAGTVVKNEITGIRLLSENEQGYRVAVSGGENWDDWVARSLSEHWYGLENLSLIPGTVGAAPVQNIGAYGKEVADYIHQVEVFDLHLGESKFFSAQECCFGYRDSIFKKPENRNRYFIVDVEFELLKEDRPLVNYGELAQRAEQCDAVTAEMVREWVIDIRRSKLPDPAVLGNAGSFFKNCIVDREKFGQLQERYPDIPSFPVSEILVKIPTAWLIDQLGWKGVRRGPIGVHDKQPLVLVHEGGGDLNEFLNLIEEIKQDVWQNFRIELEVEPDIVD